MYRVSSNRRQKSSSSFPRYATHFIMPFSQTGQIDTDNISLTTEDNLGGNSTTDNEDLADRLRKILQLQKKLSGDAEEPEIKSDTGSTLQFSKSDGTMVKI